MSSQRLVRTVVCFCGVPRSACNAPCQRTRVHPERGMLGTSRRQTTAAWCLRQTQEHGTTNIKPVPDAACQHFAPWMRLHCSRFICFTLVRHAPVRFTSCRIDVAHATDYDFGQHARFQVASGSELVEGQCETKLNAFVGHRLTANSTQ